MSPLVVTRTPTDILPAINIPVVSVVWSYTGLTATDIEQRMVYTEERALTTTVNNIEHIESNSYDGVAVIKIFFQPGVTISQAVAPGNSYTADNPETASPPGTTPPLILQIQRLRVFRFCNTASVVKGLNEQQAFDIAFTQLRVGLITVPGVEHSISFWRQATRQVTGRSRSCGSSQEKNLKSNEMFLNAFNLQALVFPSGTVKFGTKQYPIDINTFPLRNRRAQRSSDQDRGNGASDPRWLMWGKCGTAPIRNKNVVRLDGVRSILMRHT